MRQLMMCSLLCAAAAPAFAEDCGSFGFANDYLDAHFCAQFDDIIGPRTRSVTENDTISAPDGVDTEWWQMQQVQDAWRVDPAKTLLLIQRIRDAGGLPPG